MRRALQRFWGLLAGDDRPGVPRTTGYPTSSNRASSFHLRWGGLPAGAVVVEAAVTLEVVAGPAVPDLYFWALQASFVDGRAHRGAGHLGLQWHPGHPGSTAVNWGGYHAGGGELSGSTSLLPSATGNPNTRDWAWRLGRPSRLAIGRGSRPGRWRGTVDGTEVRQLDGGGSALADLMVWSEVFARCDAASVVVRWSDPVAVTERGDRLVPDRVVVTYQRGADGGCDNTDVVPDRDGAVLQRTNCERTTAPGAVLPMAVRRPDVR